MSDPLEDLFARSSALDARARRTYARLKAEGFLNDHRLISYRCAARKCLLLDVIQVPEQIIAFQPGYKLSPDHNAATSSESGRAANTVDGDRRWKARTFDVTSALNFTLECDHVHHLVLKKNLVQADIDAGRSKVVVSSSGERSVR